MSKAAYAPGHAEKIDNVRVAIVAAEWNSHITSALTKSAVAQLKQSGVDDNDIQTFHVPGAVELTFAASQLIEAELFDVIIVFGCVIRGGTPHFDYVCQSVTQGITALNADCDTPVIFGVLTVDCEQDALDRCGGPAGDKGAEAADAALKMVTFRRMVADL
ncbi:MAG: 6,7-dimethyl-8-ribityllumazine synthase [Muribaculaceae bacterium]|nr:6,7-dimethyl-8-ribityllumazine synthase [Muribaculaceae bacterium]